MYPTTNPWSQHFPGFLWTAFSITEGRSTPTLNPLQFLRSPWQLNTSKSQLDSLSSSPSLVWHYTSLALLYIWRGGRLHEHTYKQTHVQQGNANPSTHSQTKIQEWLRPKPSEAAPLRAMRLGWLTGLSPIQYNWLTWVSLLASPLYQLARVIFSSLTLRNTGNVIYVDFKKNAIFKSNLNLRGAARTKACLDSYRTV